MNYFIIVHVYNLMNDWIHSYISHINNNGCHMYFCFIMVGGTNMQKLILYFTFEILNYAIKYNFNMKTIVVIFGSHDKL